MQIPIGILKEQRPLKIHFEVTNRCNFRCDFCPIQVSERKPRDMDYALLRKGIDEIARERIAGCVGFHVLGEPLLYPKLYEGIALAKSHSLRTELTTNGSLLTADRIRALSEAGLDSLSISLQTDESEHACRGAGIPFDQYRRGVFGAIRLANRTDRLQVTLCVMDTSTRWLFDIDAKLGLSQTRTDYRQKLRRFIREMAAAIDVAPPPDEEITGLRLGRPKLIRLSDRMAIYAQPFADWGNAFTRRNVYPARFGACGYALKNLGILSNGEVTICCADYDGRTSLGNLGSHSLADLLAREQTQAIRKGFERLRPVHPHCRRCLGGVGRIKAVMKGLVSIYLFSLRGFQPARESAIQ